MLKVRLKAIEIQRRDIEIMQFAFEFRVVTYNQIRRRYFLGKNESASRNRINHLAKHGFLKTYGWDSSGFLHKCASPTEKAWDVISNSWGYEIQNPHFKSESREHDFRFAEVAMKLQKLKLYEELITENLLQSSLEFKSDPNFRDLVTLQSDGVLKLRDPNKERHLYAIEFELSKKTQDRYVSKLSSYYKAGGIDGVLFVCGTPEIKTLLTRIDTEVRRDQDSTVYLALESEVLRSGEKLLFEASDKSVIGLY